MATGIRIPSSKPVQLGRRHGHCGLHSHGTTACMGSLARRRQPHTLNGKNPRRRAPKPSYSKSRRHPPLVQRKRSLRPPDTPHSAAQAASQFSNDIDHRPTIQQPSRNTRATETIAITNSNSSSTTTTTTTTNNTATTNTSTGQYVYHD